MNQASMTYVKIAKNTCWSITLLLYYRHSSKRSITGDYDCCSIYQFILAILGSKINDTIRFFIRAIASETTHINTTLFVAIRYLLFSVLLAGIRSRFFYGPVLLYWISRQRG